MKNEYKNHIAEKEAKDYNDLKHICILLGFIGVLMVLWLGYVIICL